MESKFSFGEYMVVRQINETIRSTHQLLQVQTTEELDPPEYLDLDKEDEES